jgi:hypothetical protein
LIAAFALIPTFVSPVSAAELQATAGEETELMKMVPVLRELIKEGKVISTSTRIVDPDTGETMFLYLGNRYRDDDMQYWNMEGHGDMSKSFEDAVSMKWSDVVLGF